MKKRISLSLFLLLVSIVSLRAQDAAADREAEKLKSERRARMIDAIIHDSTQLRLQENRALVSAKLGAAIWKNDQERATTLFKVAVNSLIAGQHAAEANKNTNRQNYDLLNGQNLRPMILNAIAAADAELALESLYRSRPLTIQRALASGVSGKKINNSGGNASHIAHQEINFEHRLIRMVAEQKPERLISVLREAIKKQISAETFLMLKKVWEKDPASGNELANDIVDRLISKPFFQTNNQTNYDLISLSIAILNEYVQERPAEQKYIGFDESKLRSLAMKLFEAFIEYGPAFGYYSFQQVETIAKKFSPGDIERLRKAAERARGANPRHGHRQNEAEYSKLMNSNPSAETLIAEAKKFPIETQRSIYTSAANKLSDAGQYEQALALLNDKFEDDALDHAISSLNWYHAHHLVNRGDYDGAEAMMLEFNESNRISALTSLALTIYNRDPKENRSRANGILQRVRSFMPDKPETGHELGQLLQLVSTMATVEPTEAFRNFEPVIEQFNTVAEAWAVVTGFQGGNIRDGEFVMTFGPNFGIHVDTYLFRTLAQKDFDRTLALIDGLSRRELRMLILMSLVETGI